MFILNRDVENLTFAQQKNNWNAYDEHLQSNKNRIPASAYSFATAEWHYDPNDHKSPHDSWLENAILEEKSSGARQEIRKLEIRMTLLGAYHDGRIKITHHGVHSYKIESTSTQHGDWLQDEITLSDEGFIIHRIEFSRAYWVVQCADIDYQWLPDFPSEVHRPT